MSIFSLPAATIGFVRTIPTFANNRGSLSAFPPAQIRLNIDQIPVASSCRVEFDFDLRDN